MPTSVHNAYLENGILSADPMELVCLLYRAAVGEVRSARLHLQNGDIRSRSNAITKACSILTELTVSLDRKAGDYTERLRDLYGYMMRRLTDANFQQREEPLVEMLGLLTTLLEGWEGAHSQLRSNHANTPNLAASGPWTPPQDGGYTPQAWSF